ncbi:Rab-GAP TBC domain-containing protein, partial [Haematococcus lacustris]
MQELQDLYGFNINVTPLQRAEREACDAHSATRQPEWMLCVEQDQMPGEAKAKEMIRKGIPPPCRTW